MELSLYNHGFNLGLQHARTKGASSIPPGRQFYIVVDCHGERVPGISSPGGFYDNGTPFPPLTGGTFYMPMPNLYDDKNAYISWRFGGSAPHQEVIFTGPEGETTTVFDNQTEIECKAIKARYEQIQRNPHYEPRFPPPRPGDTPSRYYQTVSNSKSGGMDYDYLLAGDPEQKFLAGVTDCYLNEKLLNLQDPQFNGIRFSWVYYFICAYVCGRMQGDLRGVSIYVHAIFCRNGVCPVGTGLSATRSYYGVEQPVEQIRAQQAAAAEAQRRVREEQEAASRAQWAALERQQELQRLPSNPAAVYGALPALPQMPGMPNLNPNAMDEYGGRRTRRIHRRVKVKSKKQKQKQKKKKKTRRHRHRD
jgi:hypothetical protein